MFYFTKCKLQNRASSKIAISEALWFVPENSRKRNNDYCEKLWSFRWSN